MAQESQFFTYLIRDAFAPPKKWQQIDIRQQLDQPHWISILHQFIIACLVYGFTMSLGMKQD